MVNEIMPIFSYTSVTLSELHELGVLDCLETRRNVMSVKCFLELIPNYLIILKLSAPIMMPPNTCRPL
jgi:hypothetical protein